MTNNVVEDILGQIPAHQLADQLGVDESTAVQAARAVIPSLIGGLQHNALDGDGEQSLAGALLDHAGTNLFDGGQIDLSQIDVSDGEKIVGHVFGDQTGQLAQAIGTRTQGGSSLIDRLLPIQRNDFEGIFKAMDGLPVTIRTLDPPLHEFLPHGEEETRKLARKLKVNAKSLWEKVESLHEANPMLGHRGCRLGVVFPEITEMQARAIFEAAVAVQKKGVKVFPEIMIPLVADTNELKMQAEVVRQAAAAVCEKAKQKVDYMVGTMIELPRAALTADRIAEEAEFFSFGTNDLTQTTFGISRDDSGKFLPFYIENRLFADDPFQVLDQKGVGQLVQLGTERGRKTRPDLKVGICGEHGGEPSSVIFCHKVGLNYVSCSPYRVPIARLAAAQAALGSDQTISHTA